MIPKAPDHVVMIDHDKALADFIDSLGECDWIVVDTEFVRERTYFPQLGLVQIADSNRIGLIDVLALSDLTPLATLLARESTIKVFHAASQDLEVLHHALGCMPAPLFDTQIGASLLGLNNQIGYARLVDALLGKKLPKAHTRTNWCKRPIPEQALVYAADDVRYLAAIYPMLRNALHESGRLDWLIDDCDRMARPDRFQTNPADAWRRVRNWSLLPATGQQILFELAAWREREAISSDRPRRWILADDVLLAIAQAEPQRNIDLADVQGLPSKTLERHGEKLLDSVARGLARPAEPLDPNAGPPDADTRRLIKTGMRALNRAAEAADIPAGTIASRADIAAIVNGQRTGRLLNGWRAEVAGHAVLSAVESA